MISRPKKRGCETLSRIVLMFVLLGTSFGVQQHVAGTAAVSGIVHDASKRPVADVVVILRPSNRGGKQESRTGVDGRFGFSALPPGAYTLRTQGSPQGSAESSISLADGEIKSIDLTLDSASSKKLEFFDEPTFTVAGVSESSGAGVHGSDSTMRNTETLSKATASLPPGGERPAPASSAESSNSVHSAEHLRQLIAANDDPELHNQLGHVEEQSGHSLEALHEFQRAAEMNPSESNLFDWGTELLVHRAAEPAVEVFVRGNALYANSMRMLTGLAVAEYARGSYGPAVQRLCQASDLDPRNPIPYTFLGRMEQPEVKRSVPAASMLGRYAALYPKNASANYYYAVALWNQPGGESNSDNLVHVEKLLRRAIELDPQLAAAYLQMGIVFTSRQQFTEAVSALEKAVALAPDSREGHYRLAQLYRRIGNHAKADQEFAIYQHEEAAAAESAQRERKTVQQFVYELRSPPVTAQ
jgi:tetratricopeptide (TPR) repeat protein